MKTTFLNILLIFLISTFGIKSKTKDSDSPERVIQNANELLFRSKIGSQNLNTEVLVFKTKTQNHRTELLIKLNKDDKVIFSDTLSIEMTEEPFIDLRNIDDDKMDDLAIEYLRPGRGGNNISMVYLFDKEKICLKRISNSIYFPNLTYDTDLDFVSSFRFYGGDAVQMDYLKIKNDMLLPKYVVIREVQKVYLKKFEKGKWLDVGEKKIDNDLIIPEVIQLEPDIKIKNAS